MPVEGEAPIRVNLPWHRLILPLAGRLAQVAMQVGGGGEKGVETKGGRDGRDQLGVDDAKCTPKAGICSPAERGETPISQSSESVIKATSRWQ